jgi:hypothetical protein
MQRHAQSLACSNAAATSGRNELLQYQKLLTSQYQPTHNTSQVCSYNVGALRVEGEGCLSFDIAQSCPTASPNEPLGGTTFRIEARGEELKLCTVTDMFNGQYRASCALPRAGCVDVSVALGFERYQTFVNAKVGGSSTGYTFGDQRNGMRSPPMTVLSNRRWCTTPVLHAPATRECEPGWASTGATAGSSFQPRQWWESKWRWEKCRDGRAAARDGRSLAKAGLLSVDFIGESHMGFMADCLAAALYAKNVSTTAYASAKQRAKQTSKQASDNLNPPAGALAAAQNISVDKWASCLGPEKSWGCWPDWDASKGAYNRFPNVGLSTFRPTCWEWTASDVSLPRVCHTTAAGLLRGAMTLRLMLADASVEGARPLTRRNVIVVQGGSWDSMSVPSFRLYLKLIGELVAAVRALRQSAATRNARIIYVGLFANPSGSVTTGVRSSWVHAAADGALRGALRDEGLNVEVVEGLPATWPRDAASPDGIHFLRRRFRNARLNRNGEKKLDGFTFPPTGTPCIGDAGWPVALELHRLLVNGERRNRTTARRLTPSSASLRAPPLSVVSVALARRVSRSLACVHWGRAIRGSDDHRLCRK